MSVLAFHEAIPGYLDDQGATLWLCLDVKSAAPLTVFVRTEPDNEESLIRMTPSPAGDGWQRYTIEISKSPHINQTRYLFKLVSADNSWWLGSAGLEAYMPRNTHMFRYGHDRRLPMWSASQVFYQVFPERFANGDDRLTPRAGEYRYLDQHEIVIRQWGDQPNAETNGYEFFGGDLVGVRDHLSYLNDRLGITALYLNPVFTSQSSHKYDTVDYYNVDPHFGGNEALEHLINDAHGRDMKVVLDAVINHTSLMHPWFRSALRGDKTDRARYIFSEEQYASWKNHASLPTLDFANDRVVTDMMTGDDSVIRHWMRPPYQIDGWRMDVIHMLGEGKGAQNNAQYLRVLRDVIKEENDQALLLGEHFFEASPWLQGDQEDCAMNYFGFAHPVRAFLAGLDIAMDPVQLNGKEFSRWQREARARIPFSNQLLQFNQLDSHDTARFYTLVKQDKALLKLAIGLLMSYIGTPCLYYGTEIGLQGKRDPGCRQCFPWDEQQWDQDLLRHTQRWIQLRKQWPSLQLGAMVDVAASEDCVIFARVLKEEQTLIALNRGEAAQIGCPDNLPRFGEHWQREEGTGQFRSETDQWCFELPQKSITLWSRRL